MVGPSGRRAVMRCDELGTYPYSDEETLLFRAFLTPAHAAVVNRTARWMQEAGMATRIDGAGNLIGRYEATIPGAPALIIGSHVDSVRDGGRYDGPLGVMLGIECVAALYADGRRLPFAIEVIAFGDEEGSRFPGAMMCSAALAGLVDETAQDLTDVNGQSVRDAFTDFCTKVDLEPPQLSFLSARRSPNDILGYLEAHIEQGPVLEAEGLAVGVVSGIAAQTRYHVGVSGEAGHAGTSAMHLRHDALTGAAEMVLAVERIARENQQGLVATVGSLSVKPGAINVVPGEVLFSVDIRGPSEAIRDTAAAQLFNEVQVIGERRMLTVDVQRVQDLPSSPCDPDLVSILETALGRAGQPPKSLVSGASHDATVMAALCPTAMLFIRCERGISHNPAEKVDPEDADVALSVMLAFLDLLGARA